MKKYIKNKMTYRCAHCLKLMQGFENVVGCKRDGVPIFLHKSCKEKIQKDNPAEF